MHQRQLGEFCAGLSQDAAAEENNPCDAEILRLLPGVGTATLASSASGARKNAASRLATLSWNSWRNDRWLVP